MAAESGVSRSAIRVEESARERAGELLQRRRADLGYPGRQRPAFTRDRKINIRLVTDIENPQPGRNFLISSVQQIARAYAVTYESVIAVLRGEAGELVPEAPAAPAAPAQDGAGWPPPWLGPARVAAAAPLIGPIWERVAALAARGVTDPPGADVFPGSPSDAEAWDATARWWEIRDRVWMLADLQARRAAPQGSRAGAAG